MYFYRCTEQQLGDALERIAESGDTLLQAVYKGGRDWVLICRKGRGEDFAMVTRGQTDELRAAKAERDKYAALTKEVQRRLDQAGPSA